MFIYLIIWHMLAYSRFDDDVVVGVPVPDHEVQSGFEVISTKPMVPRTSWKGGRRIKWAGNNMVGVRCAEGPGAPAIIVKMQDFSESKKQVFECQEGSLLAEPLYQFMNRNLKTCLHKGLRAGGIKGQIKNIVINSMGAHVVRRSRRSSKFSMHSTGRAIDVTNFEVTLEDGKKLDLPASCVHSPPGDVTREGFASFPGCERQGPMGQFYDAFLSCWRDEIKKDMIRCQGLVDDYCRDLQNNESCSDNNGALGCEDSLHKDHMHLAVPLCPPQKGISET